MKPIPNFPDYSITKDGQVWSNAKGNRNSYGQFLKPNLDSGGYYQVFPVKNGKRHCMFVHHLVLNSFIGPRPQGMECRHLDGNSTNNRLDNLKWGTHKENMQDSIKHETRVIMQGEQHGRSKLTEQAVRILIYMWRTNLFSRRELAEIHNVSRTQISDILNKKSWKHIWNEC